MSGEINISVLIRMAAEQARRDTAAFGGDVKALGATAEEAGRKAAEASRAVDQIGTAARDAAVSVSGLEAGLAQAVSQAAGVTAQMGLAATSIGGVRNAVSGLTQAMGGEIDAMLREQQALSAWQAELDTLRARFVPLFAASQQYEQQVRQISDAETLGAITAQEATAARYRAEQSYQALAASITAVATPFNQMMGAMTGAETAMQRQVAALAGIRDTSQGTLAAQMQHGAMLDELRAKFNPLFAASRDYEVQLREIAEAERLGAISAQEAAAARDRAAQAIAPMNSAMRGNAQATGAATAANANLFSQWNDIAIMMAAGQNPMQLALQQGTQVSQVLSSLGGGTAALRAIGSSFLAMLNPISLATIGIIAFGAAGIQWLMSLGEETKSFDDNLKDLNTTLGRMKSNLDLLGNVRLEDTFGNLTGSVRGLAQGMLELDRASELKQFGEVIDSFLNKEVAVPFWSWSNFSTGIAMGGGAPIPGMTTESYLNNTPGREQRYNELGAANSFEDFERRADEIKTLAEAGDIKGVSAALVELQSAMAGGGSYTGMKDELRELLAELAKTGIETAKIEALWNNSAQANAITLQIDQMVQGYTQQVELAEASLRFGENSVQVDEVRGRHAREALRLRLAELKVQQGSADALRAEGALEAKLAADAEAAAQRRQKSRQDFFADLGRQAELSGAILQFGENSAQVEEIRARHAWEVQEARLAEMGVMGPLVNLARVLFMAEQERAKAIKASAAGRQANDLLADLREEAVINQAILHYGEDSLQVKELQIAAERRAFEQTLATMQVSAQMKQNLREAWEAARGLAAADPFGTAAAGDSYLEGQQERIDKLRLEQSLLGQSEVIQRRTIALWQVERDLRREGIDLSSARAAEIRAAALQEFELTRNIERQAAAWQNVQSSAESAIDGIVEKLMGGDIEGALEALASDITGMFTELAIQNPLKNAILGTNYGTLQDVGGLQGIWQRLFGQGDPSALAAAGAQSAIGAMQITAATVVIGGPGAAAFIAGVPGMGANLPGAPGGWAGPSDQAAAFLRSVATEGGARPDAISGLNGGFADPLAAMIAEAQQIFGPGAVQVKSGFRSVERQQQLWDEALQKHGSAEAARRWVAPPGHSQHNFGMAADLGYGSANVQQWFHQNAARYGLGFRMGNEPWHIEPQPGGAMMAGTPAALGTAESALARFGTAASDATGNLGTLGNGFDIFGNALGSAANGMMQGGSQGGIGGFLNSIGTALGNWVVGGLGIPGFATGGKHAGGLRIVGEKGPELEYTGPSTILPADLTRSILAASSPTVSMSRQEAVDTRPVININNSHPTAQIEAREETGPRGQRQYNLAISDAVAQGLTAPGGQARKTMRHYYGAAPGPRRRA